MKTAGGNYMCEQAIATDDAYLDICEKYANLNLKVVVSTWEGYKGHTHMMLTCIQLHMCMNRLFLLMMDIREKCKRGRQCVVLKFNEAHTNSPSVYWS